MSRDHINEALTVESPVYEHCACGTAYTGTPTLSEGVSVICVSLSVPLCYHTWLSNPLSYLSPSLAG